MQYFNFSRLIKKYKSDFKAITLTDGYFDEAGDWIKVDSAEKVIYGAVISHRESKIYRSEGTLTSQDKRLFTLEPIGAALQGSKAIYDGNVYSVEDNTANAKFTGVYAYTLKFVSAFKEKRPNYDFTDEVDELEQRLDGVLVETEPDTTDKVDLSVEKEALEQRLDGVKGYYDEFGDWVENGAG